MMPLPPCMLVLRLPVRSRMRRFYVPFFLIWAPALLLGILLAPLVIIISLVCWSRGGRRLLLAGPLVLVALCALRGFQMDINDPDAHFGVSLC